MVPSVADRQVWPTAHRRAEVRNEIQRDCERIGFGGLAAGGSDFADKSVETSLVGLRCIAVWIVFIILARWR